MISKEDISRINDAARIEEVIGDFVNLKKRGVNLLGLCPFHNEKTPSFVVSPAKNMYKCFGCGVAGGSVNFIMQHEQFTYPEALRYLAKKYNIEIIEKEISPEEKEIEDEKQLVFLLHEMAQNFYFEYMQNTDEGKSIGLSYFKNRNFSDSIIKKFGLGYASDAREGFAAFAISKGYTLDALKKAGLAVDSSHPIDRFRGRVTFPIMSISGRVLGFGARIMKKDEKAAKYLNSPETIIYHKSKVLYGLNLAKNAIIKNDNCYIVEGYTDVISLFQAGVENVVASSGTSLTEDQIRLIKRFTQNVTVVFDGDAAGVKAAFRGIDMLLDAGMNVKVLMLPENEDPDSFASSNRDNDVCAFFEQNAESFINYKAKFLYSEAKNDPLKKAELIKDIVQSIARIPDGITRTVFVKECSLIIDMPEQVLMNEVARILRKKNISGQTPDKQIVENFSDDFKQPAQDIEAIQKFQSIEIRISSLLLNYFNETIPVKIAGEDGKIINTEEKVYQFIVKTLLSDGFKIQHVYSDAVFQYFLNHQLNGTEPDPENWVINIQEENFRSFVIDQMTTPYTLSEKWHDQHNVVILTIENSDELLNREVRNAMKYYRLFRLQEKLEEIDHELAETTAIEKQDQLLEQRKIIQSVMKEIAQQLGTTRLD